MKISQPNMRFKPKRLRRVGGLAEALGVNAPREHRMAGRITIDIASPPDREKLVAEIFVDHEQLCELNTESGELAVEFYPRRDGSPWQMPLQELMRALAKAKEQLGV